MNVCCKFLSPLQKVPKTNIWALKGVCLYWFIYSKWIINLYIRVVINYPIGSTLGPRASDMGSLNYFEAIEILKAIKLTNFKSKLKFI